MKSLFLLRHAKSSWDNADLADFDRPLNDRGQKTAPFMGEFMRKNHFEPDVIISSPAKRARQTTLAAAKSLKCDVLYDERIYEASPERLRQVVSDLSDEHQSAMLVGHNPGMEGFVLFLTGAGETMPTAALAIIELEIDAWRNIAANCGRLVKILRPKEI